MSEKFAIVACTGMGKILASVGRYAALYLTSTLRPDETINICFPCTVSNDEESLELIRTHPVIIIDGCIETCGRKIISKLNSNVIAHLKVWEILGEHRDLKPESRVDIGEKGRKLAVIIAEEITKLIDDYKEKNISAGNQ
ncbi:MAG: putative zinc-binding protein [Promethearchaeia archaeon]